MKKNFILLFLLTVSFCIYAQDKPKEIPKSQFILIIRSKTDLTSFTKETIQTNIRHWQTYMGNLAQGGKIAGGYHTGTDGETINSDKKITYSGYMANGELVSSFLVINAADKNEAEGIAKQCPVFELGGSIEIRPIMNTAN